MKLLHTAPSIHALRLCIRAEHVALFCFWLFLFFVTSGAFSYQLYSLLNYFSANSVGTSIILPFCLQLDDGVQTFPAVTFCSLNPFKSSLMQFVQPLYTILNAAAPSGVNRKRRNVDDLKQVINKPSSTQRSQDYPTETTISRKRRSFPDTPPCSWSAWAPYGMPINCSSYDNSTTALQVRYPNVTGCNYSALYQASEAGGSPCVYNTFPGWHCGPPPNYYFGCYKTVMNMGYRDNISMTVEACKSFCYANGHNLAGLANGIQCFCMPYVFVQWTLMPASSCNVSCVGNPAETCGGISNDQIEPQILSIYCTGGCYHVSYAYLPGTVQYTLPNGTVLASEPWSLPYGTKLMATCNYGYANTGPTYMTCNSTTGQWSPIHGTCVATACLPKNFTSNPYIIANYSNPLLSINSTLTVSCGNASVLIGAPAGGPHWYCANFSSHNYTWELFGGIPDCIGTCGNLSFASPNMLVTYSDPVDFSVNSTVNITCVGGTTMSGASTSGPHYICNDATLTWNAVGGVPACVTSTSTTTSTSTASTSTTSISTTSTSTTSATTTATTASTTSNCLLFSIPNGYGTWYSSATLSDQSTCRWTCNSTNGFVPQGDEVLTCDATSQSWTWLNQTPSCIYIVQNLQNNSLTNLTVSTITNLLGLNSSNQQAAMAAGQQALSYVVAQLSPAQRALLGYSLHDLLAACNFNGRPCKTNDISLLQDFTMGNCYTFNHENLSPLYTAGEAGENTGLYLALFTQEPEYASIVSSAGFKLIVHSQDDTILPDSDGVTVAPGVSTSIAISTITYKALRTSSSPCVSRNSDVPFYFYNNSYKVEACMRSTTQALVWNMCGCASPNYAISAAMNYCSLNSGSSVARIAESSALISSFSTALLIGRPDEGAPSVPERRKILHQCVSSFLNNATAQSTIAASVKACVSPCLSTAYFSQISSAAVSPQSDSSGTSVHCSPFRNVGSVVRVYFPRLLHETIEEFQSYDPFAFVANVGGLLGIWGGMSLISIFELILIIVQVAHKIFVACLKCKSI